MLPVERDAMSLAIMRAYRARWDRREVEVLSVESDFRAPLLDEWGAPTGTDLVGRVDLVARIDGVLTIIDHKTSSADYYTQTGALPLQLGVYLLAHPEAQRFAYHVITKPRHKLKEGETAEAFADRIGEVNLYEITTPRNEVVMEHFRACVERDLRHMAAVRELGLHTPNPDSCRKYGSPCAFAGACYGTDDIVTYPITRHPDHTVASVNRLTHFKSCLQKHHLMYDVGYTDTGTSTATTFGSHVHELLASYWTGRMQPKKEFEE